MLIDNTTARIFAKEAMDSIDHIESLLYKAEKLLPPEPSEQTLKTLSDIQYSMEQVKTAVAAQRALTHPTVVLNRTIAHWMGKADLIIMELNTVVD